MLFGQNWEFCLFFSKIGQKKVFCSLLDRRLAILDYKNIDLKKSKIFHSPWFLVNIRKFCPLLFFSKKDQKRVFCDFVDRKLAILDYKNIHLKKSKILHFSREVT